METISILDLESKKMLTSSISDCKFWNKRTTANSQFLITAPSSLDNYFRSQQARIKGVHLPISVQFNRLFCNQSLQCILSKRVRGVKLSQPSQQFLQTEVKFINKSTHDAYIMTLQKLFDHYLAYKSRQLAKALYSDKLSFKIVKPFIRIYGAVCHQQYEIHCDHRKIEPDLRKLFQEILKKSQVCGPNQNKDKRNQSEQELQKIWKSTTNVRVLQEADKILRGVEGNLKASVKNIDEEKFKIRDFRPSLKKIESKIKLSKPTPQTTTIQNIPKTQTTKTAKKIKFKTQQNLDEIQQHDSDDLCYELGLLISDTDRILKPSDDEACSGGLIRMYSNTSRSPLSENIVN